MAVDHCNIPYEDLWRNFYVRYYNLILHICFLNFNNYVKEIEIFMKEIFQEYGGILITVVAILAVIIVITAVIGTDGNSAIGRAFTGLIDNFVTQANANASIGH